MNSREMFESKDVCKSRVEFQHNQCECYHRERPQEIIQIISIIQPIINNRRIQN